MLVEYMKPNIIPNKRLIKNLWDGDNKKVSSKIWNGKNNDSFQKEEWYWKIEGSNVRNKIIKKQVLIGKIEIILWEKKINAK